MDKYSGEAGEYTLTITLTPNNTGKTRTATITVSSGSEEITVTVTQKSAAESGDDTDSEEYDWVKYDEKSLVFIDSINALQISKISFLKKNNTAINVPKCNIMSRKTS